MRKRAASITAFILTSRSTGTANKNRDWIRTWRRKLIPRYVIC